MSHDTRRVSDNIPEFTAAKDMVQLLSTMEDPSLKALLIVVMNGFEQLDKRFSMMMDDLPALHQAVFNGWADKHHDHHQWVDEMYEDREEFKELCKWVKEHRLFVEKNTEVFAFAAKHKKEEEDNTQRKKAISDDLLKDILKGILFFAVGIIAAKFGII